MLSDYCKNILKAELSKPDYDGKTADQGWAWLMLPTTSEEEIATNTKLTPIMAAGVIGPIKANAIAVKIGQLLPGIATALMDAGVDLSHAATGPFLNSLVGGSVEQADIDALLTLGKRTVTTTTPRRFDRRFDPILWPHIDENGDAGDGNCLAISGFPNDLEREDFNAAWVAVGRN